MAVVPTTEQVRSVRLVFELGKGTAFESINNLELSVPDTFGRRSLRKTISQLVEDCPVELLDFAIEGILLRTTLGKFCEKYGKSRENVLEILCFQQESEPTRVSSNTQSRWLSCLNCIHLSDSTQAIAGDSEGFLNGWNLSNSQISYAWETRVCEDTKPSSVIGFNWLPSKQKFVTCLQAGLLVFSTFEGKKNGFVCLQESDSGKKNSIESVLFYSHSEQVLDSILLGTFHGPILRIPKDIFWMETGNDRPEKNPLYLKTEEALIGHSQRVSCIVSLNMNSFLSSSWDGTLKIWDLNRCCLVASTNIGRPVNTSTKSMNQDYFVTGNMDGSFTLLDSRQEKPALRKKFAHSLAITAVTSSPLKNHLFSTTGRDNKIRVWDSRALSTPFYESGGKGKRGGGTYFTCLLWDVEEDLLLAGKNDGELSCLLFQDGRMEVN